jgi:serine/threonine-protein kinase RsbW
MKFSRMKAKRLKNSKRKRDGSGQVRFINNEMKNPLAKKSTRRNELRLRIASSTEELMHVRKFVSDAAKQFGFRDDEINNIALAVDEACTNIIKHAYDYAEDQDIHVVVTMNNKEFQVQIVDHGRHFDPDHVQMPNMKEYLSHYKRGGLGMYLMKKLMDKVEYSIQPKQNVVRLTKYLHHGASH